MFLQSLQYVEDTSVDAIRKYIATMEAGLKRLEQQEQKYTAEHDNAIKEYAELQEQAAEFESDELMSERLANRPDKKRSAVSRVRSAYGDRYQPLMMYDSKRNVSELLGEETETRSIQERLWQKHQSHSSRRSPNAMNRNGNFLAGEYFLCVPVKVILDIQSGGKVHGLVLKQFLIFLFRNKAND